MNHHSLLLVGALLVAACSHEESYTKEPVAVRVRTLEQKAAAAATRYSANVEPFSRVDLAFKVGGYVREIAQVKGIDPAPRAVQEGDTVTRGTVLARVREAEYLQRVAAAKAQLAEAAAMKDQAQIELDRVKKLVESKSVAPAQLDGAKAQLDAASARSDAARAQLQEAELAVDDTAIRAPIDGVVLKRLIEVGTLVGPGTAGFAIADTRSVKVVFGVPDVTVEKLEMGKSVAITCEALPGQELEGRITRISPFADPKSRVFEVETTIANPKQELKVGMIASLKMEGVTPAAGGGARLVTVLPLNAVVRSPKDPQGFAVYVVDDKNVAHVRDVKLGDPMGNRILVTDGLVVGEKVIVQGATLVADGVSVQIIP
jgi:multidrug efflux system membrane fusion protein